LPGQGSDAADDDQTSQPPRQFFIIPMILGTADTARIKNNTKAIQRWLCVARNFMQMAENAGVDLEEPMPGWLLTSPTGPMNDTDGSSGKTGSDGHRE
jgi:hypothetical protein